MQLLQTKASLTISGRGLSSWVPTMRLSSLIGVRGASRRSAMTLRMKTIQSCVSTLQRWADLSAINGGRQLVDRELRRIVKSGWVGATDTDRDLFDHLIRRASPDERARLAEVASAAGAEAAWLDSIMKVSAERERRRTP